MEQDINIISKNLKKIREDRKLSLDKLSELTGVSKSMLRQIEKEKSSPTISTIWKIANGLKISFSGLLTEQKTEITVKNFKSEKPLFDESGHYKVFPIVTFNPKMPIEIYYLEMDAGSEFKGEPHHGNIEEQIFVIEGFLKMEIENETFIIKSNEHILFKANVPHIYKNQSDHIMKAIMQLYYYD
jgi:transcriptional regulator with XRE-family HTH domain